MIAAAVEVRFIVAPDGGEGRCEAADADAAGVPTDAGAVEPEAAAEAEVTTMVPVVATTVGSECREPPSFFRPIITSK